MKGKIKGRHGIGREGISCLKNIKAWTGIHRAGELFILTEEQQVLSGVIV